MSLEQHMKRCVELCSDPERLTLIGTKKDKTLFGCIELDGTTYRVVPKNIETVKDSFMVTLVIFCAHLQKEKLDGSTEEVPREKIVDCDWQQASSYYQGVIRGISGILANKVVLEHKSKTPFSEGVWYVQSRLLTNLKLNSIALKVPKSKGLFTYSVLKGKGLLLAESAALANLVNATIDKLQCPPELLQFCCHSPEALKSRQVLKHKNPSSKRMIYFPSEQIMLEQDLTDQINDLSKPLEQLYKAVKDRASYHAYEEGIKRYNETYAKITRTADTIARQRYPILFKKGLKGDQAARLEALELDELIKISPIKWISDKEVPNLQSKSDEDLLQYVTKIEVFATTLSANMKACIIEWLVFLKNDPTILKALKHYKEEPDKFSHIKRDWEGPSWGGNTMKEEQDSSRKAKSS